MFIQTEETPNPNTLKFLPGREVMLSGTMDFPTSTAAAQVPLVKDLFSIEGVKSIFLGADYLSVTKEIDVAWSSVRAHILATIMDYFVRHDALEVNNTETSTSNSVLSNEDLDDISQEIKELIETRVQPAVAMDGGNICFERFADGVVYLRLEGACSGCPSSSATLKSGIENMLKHYIPEVKEVQAVN